MIKACEKSISEQLLLQESQEKVKADIRVIKEKSLECTKRGFWTLLLPIAMIIIAILTAPSAEWKYEFEIAPIFILTIAFGVGIANLVYSLILFSHASEIKGKDKIEAIPWLDIDKHMNASKIMIIIGVVSAVLELCVFVLPGVIEALYALVVICAIVGILVATFGGK